MRSWILCLALALSGVAVLAASEAPEKTEETGLVWGLFSPECFEKIVNQGQFGEVKCLQLVVSKLLGYVLIAGALGLKAPQMLKILASGSVEGLAPASFYLETWGITCSLLYSLLRAQPWSTYGETAIISVQNVLLVLLFWKYNPRSNVEMFGASTFLVLFCAGVVLVLPEGLLPGLQGLSTLVFICARLPQIWTNFKNGHTGQLALVTQLLLVGGNLARIFTTLTEVDDIMVLGSFLISLALNGTVLAQILVYWRATNKAVALGQSKKDLEPEQEKAQAKVGKSSKSGKSKSKKVD